MAVREQVPEEITQWQWEGLTVFSRDPQALYGYLSLVRVIPVYLRYSQLFSSTCDFSDRNRIGPRLHSVPVAEKITLSTSYVPNCCSRTSTRGKTSVNARGLEGDILRTPTSLAFCARPLLLKGYPYFPDSRLLLFLFVGFLCW